MAKKILILLVASFLFLSCNAGGPGIPEKTVSINQISSLLINNTNFNDSNSTLYFNFQVQISEDDISYDEIESLEIKSENYNATWTMTNIDSSDFNNQIISSYLYLTDVDDYFPIGNYTFKVKLFNGNTDTMSFVLAAPGELDAGNYSFAHNEDYTPNTDVSKFKAVPKQASIKNPNLTSTSLSITFNVDDSIINNGYIYFYNDSGDFIGNSGYFVNKSGVANSYVNSGDFYTNNSDNNINLDSSSTVFETGYGFSDIKYIRVALTDGDQYSDKQTYDCITYSDYYDVTP